jgi:thiosulfate reductase/polysulfide reductase chain A
MCAVRCPITVDIENGECRFVQGNRHALGARGLCVRGAAGPAFMRDDERPQFPMLRKGERGAGVWQRLSWDEALAHAAEKLAATRERYGARGILWSDTGGLFSDLRQALVRALGSPNYFSTEAFSAVNTHSAARALFGLPPDELVYDFSNARQVVLQHRNLFESIHVQQANDLLDGMASGGKLTVVDIRSTVSAAKADRFLRICPGSDLALNLAVIHTLLTEGLYNAPYAQQWIQDLDALKALVGQCSADHAAAVTGIDAKQIVALARDLAKAAPRVIWHAGGMTSRYRDSWAVCRSAYIINALLGAVGARGGLPLAAAPEHAGRKGLQRLCELFPAPSDQRADGTGNGPGLLHKALQAVHSADPYPVKSLVVYQHDPLSELPDPVRVQSLFGQLDFLLCITSAWTQSAWQADLILPLSPYLERESPIGQQNGIRPGFVMRRRCVEPRFDTRADWQIVAGLAKKLGVAQLVFDSAETLWSKQLAGTGVLSHDFDSRGIVESAGQPQYGRMTDAYRFSTGSGRIELLGDLAPQQQDTLRAACAQAPAVPEGQFRLTFGGCSWHVEGHTVNNPLLFKQISENVLWMNQGAASALGIGEGETVEVANGDRVGRLRVRLADEVHPAAVFMVQGFGRSLPVESRACGRGVAHNLFMAGGLDQWEPTSGALTLQEHFVSVRKISG